MVLNSYPKRYVVHHKYLILNEDGLTYYFLMNLGRYNCFKITPRQYNVQVSRAHHFFGIAATLLNGGRTAHSVFEEPLNLAHEEMPDCSISENS